MLPEFDLSQLANQEIQIDNIRKIYRVGIELLESKPFGINQLFESDYFQLMGEVHKLFIEVSPPIANSNPRLLWKPLVELCVEEQPVSNLYYYCYEQEDASILIKSHLDTTYGFESRGYGLGLIQIGEVLKVRIANLPEFDKRIVVAQMVDNACGRGHGVIRQRLGKGWTSTVAEQMGYQFYEFREDDGIKRPVYRKRLR